MAYIVYNIANQTVIHNHLIIINKQDMKPKN